LVWLFKEWIGARLKASIQHEYDRNLETYKATLKQEQEFAILDIKTAVAREAAFHATAQASFAEGQKASMERKLNALDRLWRSVLDLRNNLPAVLGFMDFLTVDEYQGARDHPTFRELTKDLSPDKMPALTPQDIEEARPYTGEYLWTIYYCYRAILLRILFLLHLGRTDAEKMNWHTDGGTRQLIEAVLTPAEVAQFDQARFAKVAWIKQRLEAKILAAAQKVISGESFGADSLEQAKQIQQRIASLQNAEAAAKAPEKQ
jgi:hypothetical protein